MTAFLNSIHTNSYAKMIFFKKKSCHFDISYFDFQTLDLLLKCLGKFLVQFLRQAIYNYIVTSLNKDLG